jgi:hypothetical protein
MRKIALPIPDHKNSNEGDLAYAINAARDASEVRAIRGIEPNLETEITDAEQEQVDIEQRLFRFRSRLTDL